MADQGESARKKEQQTGAVIHPPALLSIVGQEDDDLETKV